MATLTVQVGVSIHSVVFMMSLLMLLCFLQVVGVTWSTAQLAEL